MRISQVPDPYLRKRIVVVKASRPIKTWFLLISLVLFCVGTGLVIYYFPQLKQKFEKSSSTPITHQSSSMASDNASQHPKAPESSEEVVSALASEEASAPENTAIESPTPLEKQEAIHSNTETISSSPMTEATEPMSAETETVEETTNTPTVDATEPAAETPSVSAATIEKLVTLAQVQLERQRFTSPEGDNAFETYQTLKTLAPQQAQAILEDIVNWYFSQGQDYLTQNRIKQPNRNDAYEMYEILEQIAPEHPNTQQLLADIMTRLTAQATEYLQNKQFIEPQQRNAYRIYQIMQSIAPQNPVSQQLLEAITQELLQHAQQQMANHHYTTPQRDNASDTYKQVLAIDADNLKAQQGLQAIIDKYHRLALKYVNQGNNAASLTMIERGLDVDPQAPKLLQLKQKLLEQ